MTEVRYHRFLKKHFGVNTVIQIVKRPFVTELANTVVQHLTRKDNIMDMTYYESIVRTLVIRHLLNNEDMIKLKLL